MHRSKVEPAVCFPQPSQSVHVNWHRFTLHVVVLTTLELTQGLTKAPWEIDRWHWLSTHDATACNGCCPDCCCPGGLLGGSALLGLPSGSDEPSFGVRYTAVVLRRSFSFTCGACSHRPQPCLAGHCCCLSCPARHGDECRPVRVLPAADMCTGLSLSAPVEQSRWTTLSSGPPAHAVLQSHHLIASV